MQMAILKEKDKSKRNREGGTKRGGRRSGKVKLGQGIKQGREKECREGGLTLLMRPSRS